LPAIAREYKLDEEPANIRFVAYVESMNFVDRVMRKSRRIPTGHMTPYEEASDYFRPNPANYTRDEIKICLQVA
jgi:hypothetical protein